MLAEKFLPTGVSERVHFVNVAQTALVRPCQNRTIPSNILL